MSRLTSPAVRARRLPLTVTLASALALAAFAATAAAATAGDASTARATLPWSAAGINERQAAAHLLDRFAFGPRPGDVDRLVEQGLEAWLDAQLQGSVDDSRFEERVRSLDAWRMSSAEIVRTFPPYVVLRREALAAGLVDRGTAPPAPNDPVGRGKRAEQRRAVIEYYRSRGYRSHRELQGQLVGRKLLAAAHSEKQLEAVLTDFWFNHFNVSLTDDQARVFLLSYQRDAIAPRVLGRFQDLLTQVAGHPAMLLYLDNAQSTANAGAATALERRGPAAGGAGPRRRGPGGRGMRGAGGRMAEPSMESMEMAPPGTGVGAAQRAGRNRPRGLNENFARELLELHTLGVDGGYTQEDVIAVARAFSGWTVLPPGVAPGAAGWRGRGVGAPNDGFRRGPHADGLTPDDHFVFRPGAHDAEPKTVLGRELPGGRGIEDGLDVLALVATHPSTARHLARKLAIRFVADEPPPALVDRLAAVFVESGGDLRQTMRALAYSPEFWSAEARGQKIKSPLELAVSAVRALGGELSPPRQPPEELFMGRGAAAGGPDLAGWIARMGQPLYAYQAPTGYPDRAEAWVSTGSLLTRMNFGLHLATGRVEGVAFDLAALGARREPESIEEALATYAALLLPERDLAETVRRLEPVVRDPDLGARVAEAAAGAASPVPDAMRGAAAGGSGAGTDEDGAGDETTAAPRGMSRRAGGGAGGGAATAAAPSPLHHVVGVVLGSPEFQRR
jgi:uncharacterized protein (DUF1800 family)